MATVFYIINAAFCQVNPLGENQCTAALARRLGLPLSSGQRKQLPHPKQLLLSQNAKEIEQQQEDGNVAEPQPQQGGEPDSQQPGTGGQGGGGEGNAVAGDAAEPAHTQQEIQQMGHQKAEKVSLHPINRQQQKKKGHIQKRCDDIIPHANPLLAQALGHGIGDGIAVEKGNHDGVKIMSCQIWVGNQSSSEAVARAFRYAADNGASIAQCSFGDDAGAYMTDDDFKRKCSVEYAAIQYFLDKKKCNSDAVDGNIVVFSAGNNGLKISSYPGALKEVISVTSFGPGFQPAGYTNYGTGCNIAAPGGDYYVGRPGYNTKCEVYSTVPGANYEGGYGWMEGTSMATPHVSGVVALGLAYARKLGLKFTREEFISMLLTSVNSIDSYFTGTKKKDETGDMDLSWYVGKMGTGAVDAWKLLMNIEGTPSYQVAVGQSTIDLTDVLGAPAAVLKNFSVEMDDDTRSSLGVTGELTVDGSKLSVSCTKTGSGYLTIHAESEGMPVTRKISVICRPVVSGNGGWL